VSYEQFGIKPSLQESAATQAYKQQQSSFKMCENQENNKRTCVHVDALKIRTE